MTRNKTYKWVVVALLWVVALLNYMDRQMLATLQPAMQNEIGDLRSAANFGYLMAIFLWVYGLVSPVAGFLADRFSRKWLITCSLFVWSGVTLAMGYVHSFEALYVLRAIMGFSEAMYIPAGLSLIAAYHDSKTRSLAIGCHMTGLYVGQALGGFGGSIAAGYSWHAVFVFFGLIGVIYACLLIFLLKDKDDGSYATTPGIQHRPIVLSGAIMALLGNFYFWLILLMFAVPSIPGWAAKNWLPTLFGTNLKMDMSLAGPMATITIAVSSLAGVLTGGIFSDKWVQKNKRGRIMVSSLGMGLMIPSLLLLGWGNHAWQVIGAGLLFGFGYGMFDANNMPILCQFVEEKYRATAYGMMNTAGVFLGALITGILGKSKDAGNLGRDFGMLAIIVTIALLVQVKYLRPAKTA